ncbi:MAG: hypothetical protein AMJ79_09890 [Phycisphaerae bacterium SM23_30]|nr:MAG: hypothetical protein AMJ79_09890 [Phycisphaerae bacterium SM23_30]
MKVTCNRAALHEAIQLASSIVPSRTPKPVLQCAKLDFDQQEKKLTVLATDNEISIKYTVPQVQVLSSGSAVVPAERLAAILHETTDETVDLEVTGTTCQICGKDSRFRIYGQEPGDFPVVGPMGQEKGIEVKAGVLRRLIHLTAFAAARENTRYAINGVLWEQRGKKLRMVATDGRRLARVDGEVISDEKGTERNAVVSIKAMLVLERILTDPDETIHVAFTENQVFTRTALVEVAGNLVQGRFPKYEDVIPTGCDKKVQIQSEGLRSAVRRTALLTNEQSRGIQLSFSGENLCFSSNTPEAGEAEINMKVEYQGAPLKVGFSPQYLLDMLRVVDEAEVTFEFVDGSKPGLMRAGRDFLYVIMPVSV